MTLQQIGELANKIAAVQWVKCVHPNTEPANTNDEKKANILKAAIHCVYPNGKLANATPFRNEI